ncbi:hypothetical protein KST07_02605 [Fusobacterium nucleatum]|uniref:hypothetical protein n=1 Tax=Fusobacterium nucleatum TaxID=851 RepID=UPI0030CCBEBF
MSNKIVICYDLYEADSTLRDKVVKILEEKNYTKVKNIDTLWEQALPSFEISALKKFEDLREEIKKELENLIYPPSEKKKQSFLSTIATLSEVNRSKINIKFYFSKKDREDEI